MTELFDSIVKLSLAKKLGILGSLMLFIGASYYFIWYSPLEAELTALRSSVEGPQGLRTKIAQKEGIVKNLDRYVAEVAMLDEELKKALAELPDRKEIYQLLSRVSDKARSSGLEIRLFKPKPEEKRDFYAEVPVELEVAGTFHQVATFFDEVGRMERIVNFDRISLGDPYITDSGAVTLKTTAIATSFRFLEENERPQQQQADEGAKKRRKR